jgi:phosphatidylserine decarboxylase
MKHQGKAWSAFLGIFWRGVAVAAALAAVLWVVGIVSGRGLSAPGLSTVAFLLAAFTAFSAYFFRDPEAKVPSGAGLVVAPGHGKVDVIDEVEEPQFIGGRAKRVSIFLSVFDVHVQQAPVAGKVAYLKHNPGQFLNALKLESAALNENVVIGFEPTDPAGGRVAIKLITGLIARRIIPWARVGDVVAKGERISLIQFGSRVDIYLPTTSTVAVKLGDRVVGGETVVARTAA